VLKILLVIFLSLLAVSCKATSKYHPQKFYKEVINSKYVTNPKDKPKKTYFKKNIDFLYGVITIRPEIYNVYQRYRIDTVELSKEIRHIEWEKPSTHYQPDFVSPHIIPHGFINKPCNTVSTNKPIHHFVVRCTTGKPLGFRTNKNKDGDFNKKVSFLPNQVTVNIKTDNGNSLKIPLSKKGVATANLRELGFPKSFTVTTQYQGIEEKQTIFVRNELYNLGLENDSEKVQHYLSSKKEEYVTSIQKNEKPFVTLRTLVNNNIEKYLESVSEPYILPPPILALIKEPLIPTNPTLIKSQFETKKEFQIRVQKAMDEREQSINQLQDKYAKAVNERNNELKILLKQYDGNVKKIYTQYKQRRTQLKNNIQDEQSYQLKLAMSKVLGNPELENIRYDAENKTVHAELTMSHAKYRQEIKWKMPAKQAKALYLKPELADITAVFSLSNSRDNKSHQITLSKVSLDVAKEEFTVNFDNSNFKADDIRVVLNNDAPKYQASMDTFASNFNQSIASAKIKKQWQSKTLVDNLKISALTYVNQQEKLYGTQVFNDDIPSLLAKSKAEKISEHKWLIVIGIENYQFTDDVLYAKRSAELFVKVTQKKLGIKPRNSLVLINQQASSGAIKDHLKLFLANIPKDDQLYFYYSGHGIPDPSNNNEPYILPIDKIPGYVTSDKSLQLTNIYNQLTQSKAKSIVAWIDSCFSGSTDGKSVLKGVASARLVPKQVDFNQRKMAVLTAGRKNQFSNMYQERGNRLFSYYIMKALLEDRKNINTLFQSVAVNVKDQSKKIGLLYIQEPTLIGNKVINL